MVHLWLLVWIRNISIHTLRMEGDLVHDFIHVLVRISIHTLRMEGDKIILTLV